MEPADSKRWNTPSPDFGEVFDAVSDAFPAGGHRAIRPDLESLVARIVERLQEIEEEEVAFAVFSEVFGEDYLLASDVVGLETGILHYLARHPDVGTSLEHVLGNRSLVVLLANDLAGKDPYEYCPRDAPFSSALEKLLGTAQIRTLRPPKGFIGSAREEAFLQKTQQDLADLSERDSVEYKELATRGWGELERLLHIVIRFHNALFEDPEIANAFAHATAARGLNPKLSHMRAIRKLFDEYEKPQEPDDTIGPVDPHIKTYKYLKERMLCRWRFGRFTPFGDFLEGEVEIDLSTVPSRGSVSWQDSLAKFDPNHKHSSGKVTLDRLKVYQTDVDFYRNFYAHCNQQECERAGGGMVRLSAHAAGKVIQRMLDLHLCPEMVVPVAYGEDSFGRRVAFFVHERHISDDGVYQRSRMRLVYLRGSQKVDLGHFYFCSYPVQTGAFEPFLVPVEEILREE